MASMTSKILTFLMLVVKYYFSFETFKERIFLSVKFYCIFIWLEGSSAASQAAREEVDSRSVYVGNVRC